MKRAKWIGLALWLGGCATAAQYHGVASGSHERGTVERVESIGGYSAMRLRAMLLLVGLPEHISVDEGVELYRVSYWTELSGEPQLASGLYALPRGVAPVATVMWLSPTNSKRADAVSMGNDTGTFLSAAFAGSGFVLLAPDYLGLGLSQTFHPYLDATATADAAIDFLRAAKQVSAGLGVAWQPRLMLTGFSQGAYSTAVVQRALENAPEPSVELLGSAALAPPLDLAGVSVRHALEGKAPGDTVYLAFIAHAYSKLHGKPLESVLTDEAARLSAGLFDGNHDSEEIAAKLPKSPREIFRPEALAAIERGDSWFETALEENDATRWAPKATLRLYYGDSDLDVWPDDPKNAAKEMKSLGGNVELMPMGPYDHNETAFHALPKVQTWFKELAH